MKIGTKVLWMVHIPRPWRECQERVQAGDVGRSIYPYPSLRSGEGWGVAGACCDRRHRAGTAAPLHASVLLPSSPVCFSVFLSQGSQQQRFISGSLPNPCPPSACLFGYLRRQKGEALWSSFLAISFLLFWITC